MNVKLADTELKVMEFIWLTDGNCAVDIANKMLEENGWKKNTTYTLIKRLIDKGAIEKCEPKFFCKPLISRNDVVQVEVKSVIDRICSGSKKLFFASFLDDANLSQSELEELEKIVNKLK